MSKQKNDELIKEQKEDKNKDEVPSCFQVEKIERFVWKESLAVNNFVKEKTRNKIEQDKLWKIKIYPKLKQKNQIKELEKFIIWCTWIGKGGEVKYLKSAGTQ